MRQLVLEDECSGEKLQWDLEECVDGLEDTEGWFPLGTLVNVLTSRSRVVDGVDAFQESIARINGPSDIPHVCVLARLAQWFRGSLSL